MWYLNFESNNKKLYLLLNKVYTIGRKDADIVVSNDSSVSRRHGTIEVKVDSESKSYTVVITDTSKFGTFYARNASSTNKQREFIKINNSANLLKDDVIRIGAQHTFCELKCEPLIIVTSMLDQSSQATLKSCVAKFDGEVFTAWQSNVTHLVINQVVLNVKVTRALATATSIVKDSYFERVYEAMAVKSDLPSSEDFVPPITEESLDCDASILLPNISRKTLFKNRVFIFVNQKQHKRLGPICNLAGGNVMLINNIATDNLNTLIESPNTAFILPPNNPETFLISEDKFCELLQVLASKKLRFLQEYEIGLALLYCSVEMYGNPKFDLSSENDFTQRILRGGSMSQSESKESVSDIESQSHETLFLSRVPETVQPDSEIQASGESSKKRSFTAFVSGTDSSAMKIPSKSVKLDDQCVVETEEAILKNFDTGFQKAGFKPKPAPKRKISSDSVTSVSKVMKTVKKETISPIEENAYPKNLMEDLPDSCIADDSLWSCKAESQDVNETDHGSPKRSNVIDVEDESVERKDNLAKSLHIAQSRNVIKKAFVPATVPDDDEDIDISKFDPALPFEGLSIVHLVPLVKKRKSKSLNKTTPLSNQTNTKNFKKFKKIAPGYKTSGSQTGFCGVEVPHIIGGKDLIKHLNRIDSTPALANAFITSDDIITPVSKQHSTHAASQDFNPFA